MTKVLIASILLLLSVANSCNPKKPPLIEPNTDDIHSQYVRRANADTVIVFVHGVFGGAVGTWTNSSSGAYWPKMLSEDSQFQNDDIYVYSYSSPYIGHSYAIDELIENMRLVFSNDEVFQKHKKVVFICHSMGGIVVRGFLKRYQQNAPQVPLIYFFSTPTSGAHVTQLAQFLSKNPQLHGMLPANSDSYVADLQRDWRALPVHVNSRCAYEKLDTYGIRIVDEQSASALCDGPVDPIFG
jgi:triacylglycerol esterase/lipase EstA (alpha/beta hydrolase family)